jgi:SulP family sulfate permease
VTDKLDVIVERLDDLPPVVAVRLRNMTAIDATGLRAIQTLADALRQSGRTLLLCGAREQPTRLMRQAGFEAHIGRENILPHVRAALERARQIGDILAPRRA